MQSTALGYFNILNIIIGKTPIESQTKTALTAVFILKMGMLRHFAAHTPNKIFFLYNALLPAPQSETVEQI